MTTKSNIAVESAGSRRKTTQSLSDRLREIKSEEGWVDIAELVSHEQKTALSK
ncbi:MAG: hypothetical protein ACSHXY_03910 [Alphaproteobacteria bacterium]